jgi:hypothetical protein
MKRSAMKRSVKAIVGGGIGVAALVATVMPGGLATAATSKGSSSLYPVDYTVKASTTLAKLNQTVTVPPGSFKGNLNLDTLVLRGQLDLPPAKTTVDVAGVGLADATFQLAETKEVTGKVNLSTLKVTSTASFNVLITSLEPLGLPINLVGNSCGTATPVSVTFSGKFSFSGTSKFSGDYTIPKLKNCELLTPVLNEVIPGPNNVFNASFAPAK